MVEEIGDGRKRSEIVGVVLGLSEWQMILELSEWQD